MSFAGVKEKQAKEGKKSKKAELDKRPRVRQGEAYLRRGEDKDLRSGLQPKASDSPRRSMPSPRRRKPTLIADTCLF